MPLLIHVFGPFEARLHGQPLPRLHSRKVQWLLSLLVLRHGRDVERGWLAGTLWPDSSEEAAAASLRNSLKDLRRALGPEAGRLRSPTTRSLSLDLEGAHADVLAFDTAIAQGDPGALERAVALYRGPLLEGCVEEWAFQERQNREQAYLMALETLATQAIERGELGAAERHLQRAVAAEPLRETAQRTLMQALAAGGNTAAATQVYRELRLRLHRELNAEPDPETRALYERLRAEARTRGDTASGGGAHGADRRDSPGHLVSAPPRPSGTLTFLFTDIEGSSQLWERHPEAMRAALEQHDALLRQSVQGHGGFVFKTVGDAFYSAFASAPTAVAAALEAQQALIAQEWGETGPLRVRMALHTGIAEERDGDYFGPTLNRVARLLEAGHGAQVLLSLPTEELSRDELPEGADLRPMGEHRLRDLVRPEQVFQLLHPDLQANNFPPLRSLAAFTHNLPVQWTSYIGRKQEMAALKELLPTTPLLTLTGAGGSGKTRLAQQVAADLLETYPDGAWLVELAALADPALVPQAVAAALGVPEGPGRALTATLIEHLRSRSLLLVLDNCEHLLPACARLVEALLRACPNVRILATSRERLGMTGERIYPVPPLSLSELPPQSAAGAERVSAALWSEAVCLFVERAVYTQPQFALTEKNAAAVVEVCRQLDGIPLALELAAARLKALPVEQLAARLDDAFRLLTGGSRTALPRQQTLRALIDWSYDLLSEAERTLLRRLSVFAGGWTLEAAEAVCSSDGIEEGEVLDLLTSLVEKSLVQYEERGQEPRYRLLETVRQYARSRLAEAGETARVGARHRDWFLELAERAAPELRRSDQLVWLDRLETEHDNLRVALEWCRSEAGTHEEPGAPRSEGGGDGGEAELRLASALVSFWIKRSYLSEGCQCLDAALSRGSGAPARLRVRVLLGAGQLAVVTHSDPAAGVRSYQAGLDLARATSDPEGMAMALRGLGLLAALAQDSEQATALAEESLVRAREVGDPWLIAHGVDLLGYVARCQGDGERAASLFQESLALMRQVGDKWNMVFGLLNLGGIAHARNDYEAARCAYQEGLTVSHELRDRRGMAWLLECLAEVAVAQDRPRQGARLMGAAEGLLDTIGASWPPNYVASRGRTRAAICAALGEAAFTAARAEGRAMPLEQAIPYALMEPLHEE